MKKELKTTVVNQLVELVEQYPNFYLTDIEGLTADKTSALRKECFKSDVKLVVVKNTLMRIALSQVNDEAYSPLYDTLKGNTAVMFAETANAPAKLIKAFIKENKPEDETQKAKPELKGAYVQEGIYLGPEKLEELVTIKSKEELIGDILGMLEGPIQSVVSQLASAGGTIHGLLDAIEEKNN
ncbi:50S ribosomal protein L10 [Porphyromonadaceae bacterium W3.11]|nr:50S ribosomal protein L10 [Porphyromonadaceae bacterium W3.11]